MTPLDRQALQRLVDQRAYRAIAVELVGLESARGVVSMVALGEDPEEAVSASPELSLEYDTSPRAGCSVYGYYHYRINEPAVILVHPSLTRDRDSFTIVHEYGHHVQRQHAIWANLLYSLPAGARTKLEERVADAFAAEVLIPADSFTLDSSWLKARTLAEVHQMVHASRSAVAMRAIEIAPSNDNGTVVVCDVDGVVIFARAAGDDVFTPARGISQPGLAALVKKAVESDGYASGDLQGGLRAASNWIQDDLRGDVALDFSGLYAFVVLRSTQLYGREQTWEQHEFECSNPACELVFTVDGSVTICPICRDPRCPDCNTCACEPPAASTCTNCWMALSVAEQSGSVTHECL
jgi:hypothetical protein